MRSNTQKVVRTALKINSVFSPIGMGYCVVKESLQYVGHGPIILGTAMVGAALMGYATRFATIKYLEDYELRHPDIEVSV
jgi:hypothetical protein